MASDGYTSLLQPDREMIDLEEGVKRRSFMTGNDHEEDSKRRSPQMKRADSLGLRNGLAKRRGMNSDDQLLQNIEEILNDDDDGEPVNDAIKAQQQCDEASRSQMTFGEAMNKITSYLQLDPDGGILNLCDEMDGNQVSKLPLILSRDSLRVCLAIIICLRFLTNITSVMGVSSYTMYCFTTSTCATAFSGRNAEECVLPLKYMALAVAAFELSRGGVILLNGLCLVCKFGCGGVGEEEGDEQSATLGGIASRKHERYHHGAEFFFDYLPLFMNFSGLQAVGYVHPALLGQQFKQLVARDDAAQALFEKGLNLPSGAYLNHVPVIKVLMMSKKYADLDDFERRKRARVYLHFPAFKLFEKLQRNLPLPDGRKVDKFFDVTTIEKDAWKVKFVARLELFLFLSVRIGLFAFGSMAFMTKLARVALLMFDKDAALFWVWFHVMAFLNQVMGMVNVTHLLQHRIFRFVFGGSDARISSDEELILKCYQALLVEKIWVSKSTGLGYTWKVLTLVTLNDDDLQRLMVEEHEGDKDDITRAIRNSFNVEESGSIISWFTGSSHTWIRGNDNRDLAAVTARSLPEAVIEATEGESA